MVQKSGGPQVKDCLFLLLFSSLLRQNLEGVMAPLAPRFRRPCIYIFDFECFKNLVTNLTFFDIILGCHHVWTTLFMSVTTHTPGLKSRTTNEKY